MRALEHSDPRTVGRYRLLARIGAGGMAVIYLGRSAGGRAVAVKVVHAEFARDPEFRDRFRREVAATGAVGGLYGPSLLDADPDAENPWLATEFLPSVSLREAVGDVGALPADAVWPLAAGLAEALASIHRAGVVHLDLKPANVLLTADGPRVIDFGIADRVREGPVVPRGVPAGSPGFMSPEQAAGAEVGTPSDVFSFGATLAYACTGTRPGGEGTVRVAGIADGALRGMIEDCLRSDPAARPTVPDLIDRLAPVTRHHPPSGTAWLPPAVVAEIDRRAAEAENPPTAPAAVPSTVPVGRVPSGRRPVNRRTLLAWGGAVAATGAAGVAALLPDGTRPEAGGGRPEPSTTATPAPAASSATPTPAAETRTLEFLFRGNVALTSLTYTVNGRSTTLEDVELPWRRTIEIPPLPRLGEWRIAYRHPPGEVDYRVLVDGFQVASGGGAGTHEPGKGEADGAH
ncbi:serine/threonine-protein kinase [Streptomyces macrosporus]|uniref:Protein kinase domain-containing protein n=1 Tax=Streptomyces macrosporus TaxID=44032 RepID=A0ABN3K485_9ACTN